MPAAPEQANFCLPNLLRLLADAPLVLETYLTGSAGNTQSARPLAESEAIRPPAATARSGTPANKRQIDPIARFTDAVITSHGAVSDNELAIFKQAGFDDQAALEIVLGVSLATLTDNPGQKPLSAQRNP
jgi:hypothetical protein